MEAFANTNIKLVVIPWQVGFAEMLRLTETHRFPKELVSELEAQGHQVYFGTMLFHPGFPISKWEHRQVPMVRQLQKPPVQLHEGGLGAGAGFGLVTGLDSQRAGGLT